VSEPSIRSLVPNNVSLKGAIIALTYVRVRASRGNLVTRPKHPSLALDDDIRRHPGQKQSRLNPSSQPSLFCLPSPQGMKKETRARERERDHPRVPKQHPARLGPMHRTPADKKIQLRRSMSELPGKGSAKAPEASCSRNLACRCNSGETARGITRCSTGRLSAR